MIDLIQTFSHQIFLCLWLNVTSKVVSPKAGSAQYNSVSLTVVGGDPGRLFVDWLQCQLTADMWGVRTHRAVTILTTEQSSLYTKSGTDVTLCHRTELIQWTRQWFWWNIFRDVGLQQASSLHPVPRRVRLCRQQVGRLPPPGRDIKCQIFSFI